MMNAMSVRPIELQLPLDADEAGSLARRRVAHLGGVEGVEPSSLIRLLRAFPSLRAIYAAPEAELAKMVGPVAAARIRWFLDAPLDSSLAREESARAQASAPSLRSAA